MFERWAERMRERRGNNQVDIEFDNDVELADEVVPPVAEPAPAPAPAPTPTPAQAPAPSRSIVGANIELKVVRPATFEEVGTIADHLLSGCTVVINFELLDRPTITRMLDFIYGVAYTMDGDIKNVALNTYIVTPNGIDVNG